MVENVWFTVIDSVYFVMCLHVLVFVNWSSLLDETFLLLAHGKTIFADKYQLIRLQTSILFFLICLYLFSGKALTAIRASLTC